MTDKQLSEQLRKLKINTKSIACLGCGHENSCSVHGCNLIGMAADRLATYEQAIETIKAMRTAASGVGKSLLRDVLSLFDSWYGQASEPPRIVCDFERCTERDLPVTILKINDCGYNVFAVTQNGCDFTVFYHRPYPID